MVTREEIQWELAVAAVKSLRLIRDTLGEPAYGKDKLHLQEFLAAYFSSSPGCLEKSNSIAPLAAHGLQGKLLKVRWGSPGRGKSGGLRLAVLAYCAEKRVRVAGAWARRTVPSDEDFTGAAERADAE